uniref:Uncharacterized protein n=1 Tax=Haplochromis burtoni TaxID=8153 RepID=A0A3Q2V7Z7_HAPBU
MVDKDLEEHHAVPLTEVEENDDEQITELQTVRKSERVRTLTEKGKELQEKKLKGLQHRYTAVFEKWRYEARLSKVILRNEVSESELNELINNVNVARKDVQTIYEQIRQIQTPDADERRKPKVFLIQACQGSNIQRGVQMNDMEIDDDTSPLTIPEEADVLVAMATVEDHASLRHIVDGSWFVQSLCEQLKERCPRGEDIVSILHYVNDDVAHRETSSLAKQMPEVRFTLRKKLVLPPQCT